MTTHTDAEIEAAARAMYLRNVGPGEVRQATAKDQWDTNTFIAGKAVYYEWAESCLVAADAAREADMITKRTASDLYREPPTDGEA